MTVKRIININLPGSKSYTNRALICAALADGRTRLFGYGECEDSLMMAEALKKMGIHIDVKCQNPNVKSMSKSKCQEHLEIRGGQERLRLPKGQIYVGNTGTAMRFLASLIGLIVYQKRKAKSEKLKTTAKNLKLRDDDQGVILTGSERMMERPIGDLLEALGELGIHAESVKENECPPIRITNYELRITNLGGKIKLKGDASSQYLSSILLCAPYFDKDTEIEIIGELTSKPYVDMTIQTMRDFGVRVINQNYRHFKVKVDQKYRACDYQIEPDASAASYFMAGAALTGKTVRFPGLSMMSKQGDIKFVEVLEQIKNLKLKIKNCNLKLKIREDCLIFKGSGSLSGISVDMNCMPDMVPTLAVLAIFAKGRTVIRNVANLRIKETDRLRALATEIRKFGIEIKEKKDGLEIVGRPELRNRETDKPVNMAGRQKNMIKVKTYNDHRMAMAFAVAKLVIPDMIIENPGCTAKSFPGFWNEWRKLCIQSL